MQYITWKKIVNLLNDIDSGSSKFATKKWYVIDDQTNTILWIKWKFKYQICDLTGAGGGKNTNATFRNCAPFTGFVTHTNKWTHWYSWKSPCYNVYVQFAYSTSWI